MNKPWMRRLRGAVVASLAVAATALLAQDYPSRPITLVSPFPAGSGSDQTARAIAPALRDALGQPVVVDNRPGAGGAIGARSVARSAPDGYTLLLGSASFSVLPSVTDAGYDAINDFEPIILMGTQPMALVVPPDLPVKSLRELVDMAKAKPGVLNYSSAGIGSLGHLQWELLQQKSGTRIVHVPFNGTPQALAEVMSGRVQGSIVALPVALSHIRAGTVKALGVQGEARAAAVPDVPTMAEAGFPDLGDAVWYIVMAPKGTPRPIIDRLNTAMKQALAVQATKDALGRANVVPTTSTAEQANTYLKAQVTKWATVVKEAGIQPGRK